MKARWITDEQNTVPPSTRLLISYDGVDFDSCGDDEHLALEEDDARWLYELLKARFNPPVNARIPIPGLDPDKWLDRRLIGDRTGVTLTPNDGSIVAINTEGFTVGLDTSDTAATVVAAVSPPVVTDLQGVITRMAADPMVESVMAMNRLAAHDACDEDKPVIEEAVLVINLLREFARMNAR